MNENKEDKQCSKRTELELTRTIHRQAIRHYRYPALMLAARETFLDLLYNPKFQPLQLTGRCREVLSGRGVTRIDLRMILDDLRRDGIVKITGGKNGVVVHLLEPSEQPTMPKNQGLARPGKRGESAAQSPSVDTKVTPHS